MAMAKYVTFFGFTTESARRFVEQPSDRAAVVRGVVESAGGSMESYYWMLGQYDGLVIFELPDSKTAAALSLAVSGSGAFSTFETHELIEASDLAQIAEQAKQISFRPPGS
jgi:uncharacterized protein with GYD domain